MSLCRHGRTKRPSVSTFYVLVTIFPTKSVQLPRKMVIACEISSPTLREQLSRPSGPIKNEGKANATYKPRKSKKSQMKNRGNVKKDDEWRLKQDWCSKMRIADGCVEFKFKLISMLSSFRSTWERFSGRNKNAKYRMKLSWADAKPIHSVPYQAGPKARKF